MKLMPHQIEDAAFLASKTFAGCFTPPGGGKTLTALEAYRTARTTGLLVVVAPPIALRMWQEVYTSYVGGSSQIIRTGRQHIDEKAEALFISYALAIKLARILPSIDVLILDESHAVKTPTSKRTQALIGIHGLCDRANHTWLLTGTPSTRYNDDLYSFAVRAAPRTLALLCGGTSLDKFRLKFCITQMKKFPGAPFPVQVTVGNKNTSLLNQMLLGGGMAVRRSMASIWPDMPPVTTPRLEVDLESDEALEQSLSELDDMTSRQLEQAMAENSPTLATARRLLGCAKVSAAVAEIDDRIDSGGYGPILVGAWHTGVIDRLSTDLSNRKIGVIDGRTSHDERGRLQDLFNADALDVLICQIAAAGVSLNLQLGTCRNVIFVEEDYSPAINDQFVARIHRIGTAADSVHVDVLTSDTRLDKAIYRISATKKAGHVELLKELV